MLDLGGWEAHHSCLLLSNSWLQHSATVQPVRSRDISVKGKKERQFSPFLFLLCCFRRCRAEKCDPLGSLQIVRWGYIEKAKISYRRPCIEKFQIQLILVPLALKCLLVEGIIDDAVLRHQTVPSGLFHGHSRAGVGCCQWTVKFLHQTDSLDSHFFHRNVRISDSLLMVKHFVNHFSLEMKTKQLIMLKRNVSQRTGKCTYFESWWKTEPSVFATVFEKVVFWQDFFG